MRLSHFFISRPIFASVISIVITLLGIFAIPTLPLSEYPEVVPPTITINATYPGASPETIAETVAAPIEQAIKGSRFVNQVVLIGSERKFPAALIVPNWEQLESYCKLKGIEVKDRREMREHPRIIERMDDLHIGHGPYYSFFRPYHLTSLEVPLTCARIMLSGKPDMVPLPSPVAEVCAVAKRDLKPGETFDAIGETCYRSYTMTMGQSRAAQAVPVGLLEGGRVVAPVKKGELLTTANSRPDTSTRLWALRREQETIPELQGQIHHLNERLHEAVQATEQERSQVVRLRSDLEQTRAKVEEDAATLRSLAERRGQLQGDLDAALATVRVETAAGDRD